MTVVDIILLIVLVLAALATVMLARLLYAVLALALTSAVVAMLLFRLGAPLAAVFELSVCAGLIPAVFISAIGLTRRLTSAELAERKRVRLKRYWALPMLVILAGLALTQISGADGKGVDRLLADARAPQAATLPAATEPVIEEVRGVLWNQRHADLLGQIVVLLGGAFGVVILLKESKS